jgi:mRNA interferase RelE/StbE
MCLFIYVCSGLRKVNSYSYKYLDRQDIETKNRLIEGLKKLEHDPLSHDVKKLKGTKGRQDLYRLRIGGYRAVFSIDGNVVYVLGIIPLELGYGWL